MAITKEDVDKLIKFEEKTDAIMPLTYKEGDFIEPAPLINKLNEIIAVLNSLPDIKLINKPW